MGSINIGIEPEHRAEIAQALKHLLADSYTLYLQTHNSGLVDIPDLALPLTGARLYLRSTDD